MTRPDGPIPKPPLCPRSASFVHMACLALSAAALFAEFLIAYSLMVGGGATAPLRPAWAILVAGLLLLALQGVLVQTALVRPLREAGLRVEQLAQAMEQHTHRDLLTGLLNRIAFEQMVVRELESLRRYGAGFCGVMLDAEGLRRVNETQGYEAGDLALHELGQLLKRNVRKADLLFRWRSGTFLLLATGIGPEQAQLFAEKLRRVVEGHEFRPGVRLGACVAVAQARPEDEPEQFVARMKTALALERERCERDGPEA